METNPESNFLCWRVTVVRGGSRWLVVEVAGSLGKWLQVADSGRDCKCICRAIVDKHRGFRFGAYRCSVNWN